MRGAFPPFPVEMEQVIDIFVLDVKLRLDFQGAELFLEPRSTHGAALENQAGGVEAPKLWNCKTDSSSICILAMPQGVLRQPKHIDSSDSLSSNNLTMVAPTYLITQ